MRKFIINIIAFPIALILALVGKAFLLLPKIGYRPILGLNTLANFVPEIWLTAIIEKLRNSILMRNLVNTELERELASGGRTAKKLSLPTDIDILDYVKGVDNVDQDVDSSNDTFTLDQEKYFQFKVDNIDEAQTQIAVGSSYLADATAAAETVIDSKLLSHFADVDAANQGGDLGTAAVPIDLTAAVENAYDTMLALKQRMSDANWPVENRWVVVRPQFVKHLQKSPTLSNRDTIDGERLRNTGAVDIVSGILVFESTNISKLVAPTAHYNCLAGYGNIGIDFALTIQQIEAEKVQKQFAARIMGLYVYGSKVFDGKKLALAVIKDN